MARMKKLFVILSCACVVAGAAEPSAMTPLVVPWPEQVNSPADVSFLLQAPAGKQGFVTVKDGHLATPDGARLRLWGINATMAGALPEKAHAAQIAAGLARRGINCVRLHMMDKVAPAGLIAANRDDTRALDPQQLDRLDCFVSELKKRGIYIDLNLNVGRTYKAGDGVKDYEILGFAKSLTFFDERLLELQREYARQLLTHVNAYTGNAYAAEPAVALIEFINENSLVEAWMGTRLRGQNTKRPSSAWSDIPASYAQDLNVKFNDWLKKKFPAATIAQWKTQAGVSADALLPRLNSNEFAKAAKDRFYAEAEFYLEIERNFFLGMAKFLREELKVKQLFAGNSDHSHSQSGYPQLSGTSLLDVVDGHDYWEHPNYLNDPKTGKKIGFAIKNSPMVNDPQHSVVAELARSAFAGKPYTVSEINHPFPAENASEGVPILAAYAAFQDWDGIFWYSLGHQDVVTLTDEVHGHFDFAKDPVKMSQLAAGALLFLRTDVAAAKTTVLRSYTRQQVCDSILVDRRERPFFTPGFSLSTPLVHATRIASLNGPATGTFPEVAKTSPLCSDTGELNWLRDDQTPGLVLVDTPRSQYIVGHCQSAQAKTRNLALAVENRFCAVTLSAVDAQPIAQANRLLLTATAAMGNTGMTWNEKRNATDKWGAAPTVIETVTGTLTLKALATAKGVTVQPLDGAGRPAGQSVPAQREGDGWKIKLGATPAVSYWLTVSR